MIGKTSPSAALYVPGPTRTTAPLAVPVSAWVMVWNGWAQDPVPVVLLPDVAETWTVVTPAAGGWKAARHTIRVAEPVCPSTVALIDVVPAPMAVTSPEAGFTVATAGLVDAKVAVLPVSAAPPASRGVAVPWVVWPIPIVLLARASVTVATGARTVTPAFVLLPSLVTVMLAVPAATAVMTAVNPLPATVATPAALDSQVTVRPVRTLPLASLTTAVACVVWPTCSEVLAMVNWRDATAIGSLPELQAENRATHAVSAMSRTATG